MFNFRKKPKLIFVYGERYKYSGSTIMRGDQLSQKARQHFKEDYVVSYKSADASFKNSTLFVTKGAIQSLNTAALKSLRERGNLLLFDPVDSILPADKASYADVIIAASQAAQKEYETAFPDKPCLVIDHHVDPRLTGLAAQQDNLAIGYFGELVNTIQTNPIAKYVSFVGVDTSKKSEDWFAELPKFSMHYTVRNREDLDVHKPFLKGFTAAHLGANVIAHHTQTDIERWLGKDYPYLIREDLNEENILRMLEHVRETYDTAVWHKALKRMETIKQATSDEAILDQLQKVIEVAKTSEA